ncbi:hypothetical protein [Pontibacter sp. G13]|uniref:hypothetical protein n=1 Tax=Pontibacter sp. G13 TaxID=3074898 RepID=UPI002888FB39|nr:hypothetical protein [Pontibacter sp. G13]WNJ17917.1 hypothetical protein RJD25_23940 [Pontibacter sp. G13]
MRRIFIESLFTIVGMAITIPYMFHPTPYLMFLFVFVATPCFIVAIVMALVAIVRDLRTNKLI